MPTYEYACRDCGEHLEVVQSFKDEPLTVCGSCGGALRKVFSAAGIIFKGSGYYVTDTRDKGSKSPTAGTASDSSSDAASGSSSGDGGGSTSTSTTSTSSKPSTPSTPSTTSDSGGSTAKSA
jgi:putative FmdB family regulatory protein